MKRQCHCKVLALVLLAFLVLAVSPSTGNAEDFFDSQSKALKIIDGTLAEGMSYGHYGLVMKTVQFMQIGESGKDAPTRLMMNKVAWYNAVNGHRMLDGMLQSVQNPDTRRDIMNLMKLFDSSMVTLGKRFGWNSATTVTMHNKTRALIEARITELRQTAFSH